MNYECNKCGSIDFLIEPRGCNIGLFCSMCGKWKKWLSKDEYLAFQHNQATIESKYKTFNIECICKATIKGKNLDDVKKKFNDIILENQELENVKIVFMEQ